MLTPFGKFCNKLRIDLEINQGEMAEALGVSNHLLSCIEHGKKSISSELLSKIQTVYKLTNSQFVELCQSAVDSPSTMKINVEELTPDNQLLLLLLYYKLDKLTGEERSQIKKILLTDEE